MEYKPRGVPGDNISLARFYDLINLGEYTLPPHLLPLCDALDDLRIDQLMLQSGPSNGKSTVTSQIYPLLALGKNPKTQIMIVSSSEGGGNKFFNSIKATIESNEQFRYLFPDVRPSDQWNSTGLNVTGSVLGAADPSVVVYGLDAGQLTSAHANITIFDDIHNHINSATSENCKLVVDKYVLTLSGRLSPGYGRRIVCGRRFHPDDLYGTLMKLGSYVTMTLPAERKDEKRRLYYDVTVPRMEDGSPMPCVFSERYLPDEEQDPDMPYVRYKVYYGEDPQRQGFFAPTWHTRRRDYFHNKKMEPMKTDATYNCNPTGVANPVFLEEDFCYFNDLTYEDAQKGISSIKVREFIEKNNGFVVQSWDTAHGNTSDSAYSACITGILVPSQSWHRAQDEFDSNANKIPCQKHFRTMVVDVKRQKLTPSQLLRAAVEMNRLWKPKLVLVEDKDSGSSLIDQLRQNSLPVEPTKANRSKFARATEMMDGNDASAQGYWQLHRVVCMQNDFWLPSFKSEHLEFTGLNPGKKDMVDATVHLINRAIRMAGKSAKFAGKIDEDVNQYEVPDLSPLGQTWSSIASLGQQQKELQDMMHPLNGLCGRCVFWEGHKLGVGPNQILNEKYGKIDMSNPRFIEPEYLPRTQEKDWCQRHKKRAMLFDTCQDYEQIGGVPNSDFW